jgi:hypothetical protein
MRGIRLEGISMSIVLKGHYLGALILKGHLGRNFCGAGEWSTAMIL